MLVTAAACRERVQGYAIKSCVLHDEAIALLCATCHESDYEHARLDLANSWVPGAKWKAFFTTDKFACFGQIRSDLFDYDIHPPLYFWLLHLTGILGGFGPTTGPRLNAIVHGVELVALMLLVRRLTSGIWTAVAAAALWSFSPAAFETTFYARQYELLGCFGILTVLAVHCTLTSASRPRWCATGLALALAGMTLTHWYGLVGSLYVGGLVVALALLERDRTIRGAPRSPTAARFRLLAGAWAGAQALTLALHPRIVAHFLSIAHQRSDVEVGGIRLRTRQTFQTLGGFFGVEHGERAVVAIGVLLSLLVAVAGVPYWQLRRARAPHDETFPDRVLANACAAVAMPLYAGVVTIPFLFDLAPSHSMSARYLSLLWPMWAIGLVWAFCGVASRIGRQRSRVPVVSLVTLPLVAWAVSHGHRAKAQSPPLCGGDTNVSRTLPLVRTVITDNTHRGIFGQSIPFIRDDALVFAFPPTAPVVPDRPPPPPVNEDELVRGLTHANAVSIFHHWAYGISKQAPDAILHALKVAGLDLASMTEWPFGMPGLSVLITHNSSMISGGPSDVLEQLQKRGSALVAFGDVEGYAGVLLDGKLVKEVISSSGDANLSASDLPRPMDAFSIVSGSTRSSITLGRYRYENPRPGFLVLLYDPSAHRVVYRATFPAGRPRQPVWSDIALRPP